MQQPLKNCLMLGLIGSAGSLLAGCGVGVFGSFDLNPTQTDLASGASAEADSMASFQTLYGNSIQGTLLRKDDNTVDWSVTVSGLDQYSDFDMVAYYPAPVGADKKGRLIVSARNRGAVRIDLDSNFGRADLISPIRNNLFNSGAVDSSLFGTRHGLFGSLMDGVNTVGLWRLTADTTASDGGTWTTVGGGGPPVSAQLGSLAMTSRPASAYEKKFGYGVVFGSYVDVSNLRPSFQIVRPTNANSLQILGVANNISVSAEFNRNFTPSLVPSSISGPGFVVSARHTDGTYDSIFNPPASMGRIDVAWFENMSSPSTETGIERLVGDLLNTTYPGFFSAAVALPERTSVGTGVGRFITGSNWQDGSIHKAVLQRYTSIYNFATNAVSISSADPSYSPTFSPPWQSSFGAQIRRIVIHPDYSNRMWAMGSVGTSAGTWRGVIYESTDSGLTWNRVYYAATDATISDGVVDLILADAPWGKTTSLSWFALQRSSTTSLQVVYGEVP